MLRAASSAAIQPPSEMADQIDVVEIELVEQVEIEVGEVGDGVEPVRRVGGAEARMLGHDHVVARGEVGHVGQPAAGAAGAVQEQQRTARAAAHQADVAAADREFGVGVFGHVQSYNAQPPSIRWVWPLMKADSSEAR